MELRGNLGTHDGHVEVGKNCVECGEYFVENIILDDFIPKEHLKDDLCFECLIVQVFIPAVEQMMIDQENNTNKMLNALKVQKEIIDEQAAIIEGYKVLHHKDLALLDMKKPEVAHGGDH